MVQILNRDEDWANAFQRIGSGVAEGYQNRADEMAIQKAINNLGPNAQPKDVLNVLLGTKTYSPEAKQTALKNFVGVSEFEGLQEKAKQAKQSAEQKKLLEDAKLKIEEDKLEETKRSNLARENLAENKKSEEIKKKEDERKQVKNIVSKLKLSDEEKETLGESLTLSGAEDLLKHQIKGTEEKFTPFEKKVQEKQAEDYISLTKEIPKVENVIDDLDYVEQLSSELGYLGGITAPLSGLVGTEKAKELEAVSFPLIEPIVKIFNPSGPIATQKLKIIQERYQIKATDWPWQTRGKLNALRRFAKQGLQRAKDRMKLIEKYNGKIPEDKLEEFDKESETMTDAMADYDFIGKEVNLEGVPSPEKMKGKTITSPDGQKYYSDGTRWLKR